MRSLLLGTLAAGLVGAGVPLSAGDVTFPGDLALEVNTTDSEGVELTPDVASALNPEVSRPGERSLHQAYVHPLLSAAESPAIAPATAPITAAEGQTLLLIAAATDGPLLPAGHTSLLRLPPAPAAVI